MPVPDSGALALIARLPLVVGDVLYQADDEHDGGDAAENDSEPAHASSPFADSAGPVVPAGAAVAAGSPGSANGSTAARAPALPLPMPARARRRRRLFEQARR